MRLPPQPLNHEQRQRACALLAMGATREMACRYAGCRVLDLKAELQRAPDFKQQVQEHELRPEIEVLRSLLAAAREPKEWRAAAWVLERFYPRRYATRKADALRPAHLRGAFKVLDQKLALAIPDPEQRRQLLAQLQRQGSRPKKRRPKKARRTKPRKRESGE